MRHSLQFSSTLLRDMSPCFYTYGLKVSGKLTASICTVLTKIRQPYVVEAVGNLNEVKPNERIVKCRWVKFKWEQVNCR
jgi:hypothetical protein